MGNPVAEGRRALIRNMWNERIKGTKRNVEVNILLALFHFILLFFSIVERNKIQILEVNYILKLDCVEYDVIS